MVLNKYTKRNKNIRILEEEMSKQYEYIEKIRKINEENYQLTGFKKLVYLHTYGCPYEHKYKRIFTKSFIICYNTIKKEFLLWKRNMLLYIYVLVQNTNVKKV